MKSFLWGSCQKKKWNERIPPLTDSRCIVSEPKQIIQEVAWLNTRHELEVLLKYKTVLCTFLKSWKEIFPVRSLSKVMNFCLICLQESWIILEFLSMASTHWLLSGPGLIWRTKSENAAWVYSHFINYTRLFRMTAGSTSIELTGVLGSCSLSLWDEVLTWGLNISTKCRRKSG